MRIRASVPREASVDAEQVEDFVLANAPSFVAGTAAADRELAAGETVSLAQVRQELEAD